MTTTTDQAVTLDAIAHDGIFSIIAMDQRNTLRRMFAAVGNDSPTLQQLNDAKIAVAHWLTPLASGILLDPTIGVPAVAAAGARSEGCGLLIAAEPEKRDTWNGEPRARFEPSQDGLWVREQGGQAMKFLVQLRADRATPAPGEPDLVKDVLDTVRQLVASCRVAGIPAVVENLIYTLPGEELTPQRREDAIIQAAIALNELDIDLLKLEYPGSPKGAARLAQALDRPWAVLSAGVAFDQFTDALAISYDAGGASGFIAGRSVWKESIGLEGRERDAFFVEVARPRLQNLVEFSVGRARPWSEATKREA